MQVLKFNIAFSTAIFLLPMLATAGNYKQLLELRVNYSPSVQTNHQERALETCFTTADVLDREHCVSLHGFLYVVRNHYNHGPKKVKFSIFTHASLAKYTYRAQYRDHVVYRDECNDMLNTPHRTPEGNGKMLYSASVDFIYGQVIYSNCHKAWVPD